MLTMSVSFFNELDIEWDLCSQCPFHFLTSLTQNGNYAHQPVSFLMSLTEKKNYAHGHLFHFLTILTHKGNYARGHLFKFFNELDTERELCSLTVLSQHDVQRLVGFPLT